MLEVLIATEKEDSYAEDVPQELIDSFEECCRSANLLDEDGRFNDAYRLVELFCRKIQRKTSSTKPGKTL